MVELLEGSEPVLTTGQRHRDVRHEMFDRLADKGIEGLLTLFTEATAEPCALIRLPDQVIASSPPGFHWPPHDSDGARFLPINADVPHALYAAGTTSFADDLACHVAGLVRLELARVQALKAGRRELTGQVIEDLVRSTISSSEAARRLTAAGVDPAATHSVLLVTDAPIELDDLTGVVVARIGPYEAVVLEGDRSPGELTRLLSRSATSIGVGGPYRGVHGLRWAFLEAQEAVSRGPGVHEGRVIDMPRLLMSNPDLPVREVARKVLQPVLAFDAEHGGQLMRTLEVFLESGGSPQVAAKELFVHRNTVRYRLEQIERVTGLSLSSVEARVNLWLAMRAVA